MVSGSYKDSWEGRRGCLGNAVLVGCIQFQMGDAVPCVGSSEGRKGRGRSDRRHVGGLREGGDRVQGARMKIACLTRGE